MRSLSALHSTPPRLLALAFGVKKFQFMHKWVTLVGEIVGEDGHKPNPAMCEAIRKWPPISTLTEICNRFGYT